MKKRSEIEFQVFVYVISALTIILLLFLSFNFLKGCTQQSQEQQLITFQNELEQDIELAKLKVDSFVKQDYLVSSFSYKILVVDSSKKQQVADSYSDPIIAEMMSGNGHNIFVLDLKENIIDSWEIEDVHILDNGEFISQTTYLVVNEAVEINKIGKGSYVIFLASNSEIDSKYISDCDYPTCKISPEIIINLNGQDYLQGEVGEVLIFNASGSYDPNGEIVEYQWAFGDDINETTTIAFTSHSYSDGGDYSAFVLAIDNDGDASRKYIQVKITEGGISGNDNVFASISLISVPPYYVDEEIMFSGESSSGEIIKYTWSFFNCPVDDGCYLSSELKYGETVEYAFVESGHKKIRLEVEDGSGNIGLAELEIEVLEVA